MNLKLDSQLLMARDNFRPDPMDTNYFGFGRVHSTATLLK